MAEELTTMERNMTDTIVLPSMAEIRKSKETEHYARFVVVDKPEFVEPHKLIDDFEHMRELGFRVVHCHAGQLICEKVTP